MPSSRKRTQQSNEGPPRGLRLARLRALRFCILPSSFHSILYAFSTRTAASNSRRREYTLRWFGVAWNRPDIWAALGLLSGVGGSYRRALAIVLGTLAAAALARAKVPRREADLPALRAADRPAWNCDRHCAALGL